jgi:hypothetical protein
MNLSAELSRGPFVVEAMILAACAARKPGSWGELAMRLICLTICGGLCAIPLCALAAFQNDFAPQSVAPSTVERATKGNRMMTPFNVGVRGVSVEITGQPTSAITVRDPEGNTIYQVDPANRMTIVAKRTDRSRAMSATTITNRDKPEISLPFPEGCESAFSPYATPNRAHVIGRCIS